MKSDPQYWVAGAMFNGDDDQLATFVRRGYWYCWDPRYNSKRPPTSEKRFLKMRPGDRIAVKRMLGQGSKTIEIRALGIVSEVDLNEWRVYGNWLTTDLSREVSIKNYMGSLHGPVKASGWRDNAFSI